MLHKILILLAIICLIFVIIDNICDCGHDTCDRKEHYDMKIPDISVTECGTRCTEGLNCSGFAYKPTELKCYLSKTPIFGSPINSIYKDDYSLIDRRCNKINRITDDRRLDGNTLTNNSVYLCSDGEHDVTTQFQYANLGATALESVKSTIFDRADSDIITPTNVSYEVYEIDWPKSKSTQTTSINPFYTSNNTNSHNIDKRYGFIESDKEFLGQYLLAHQCVANVPLFDCLKYCENNPNCAGTEWNKSLVSRADGLTEYLYENVCCPKTVIKKIIPRRDKFNRGRFYIKKDLLQMTDRDKVTFSKADFDSVPPTNDRFIIPMTKLDQPPEFNEDATSQNVYSLEVTYDNLDYNANQ